MKSFTFFIIFMILPGISFPEEPISFNWTFLYKQGSGNIESIPADTPEIILSPGDGIKIYLQPINNAYLYLYLLDASEHLYLLFPGRINYFDLYYTENTIYSFPKGNEWAVLDSVEGTEEFIFIASSARLEKLEHLTISCNKLYLKENKDTEKLAQARYKVLEEIQRLKHEYSPFMGKTKQKLIKAAVKIRNTGEIQDVPMFHINTDTCFIKTIWIKH